MNILLYFLIFLIIYYNSVNSITRSTRSNKSDQNKSHINSSYSLSNNTNDMHNMNISLINSVGYASFEKIKDENANIDLEKIIYAQSMISRSLLAWLSIIGFLVITGVFI